MSFVTVICLFFLALSLLSCGKKAPEPPKPPAKKVEATPPKPQEPPKPPEPPRQEVQETSTPKEPETPIPKKHKKKALKNSTYRQEPLTPIVSYPVRPPSPQIVSLDGLNRAFKANHLNVWASEWNDNGILLNGYVKSERERRDALILARLYNTNITDMINVVTVYDNRRWGR